MYIKPDKANEIYKPYARAKGLWSNIRPEEIDNNSNLMYELLQTINQYNLPNPQGENSEKKEEAQNRFTDFGIFMLDSGAIDILATENNVTYSFGIDELYHPEENPFLLSIKDAENMYKIDEKETLIETKCRVLDCENKIAKMGMAQIAHIMGTEKEIKAISPLDERRKQQIVSKIQQYTTLLNRAQITKIQDFPELDNTKYGELFDKDGFLNINKFLEVANDSSITGKDLKQREKLIKYNSVFKKIAEDKTEENYKNSIKGMNFDIIKFGKFAIAKKLITKMYMYKNIDIKDIVMEYDLIKGTKEADNVLISTHKDSIKDNTKTENSFDIYLKGYTQPFSVHIENNVLSDLEKRYGSIPQDIIKPVRAKSIATAKMSKQKEQLMHKINGYNNPEISRFLEYYSDLQNIPKLKKDVKQEKILQDKPLSLQERIKQTINIVIINEKQLIKLNQKRLQLLQRNRQEINRTKEK